MQNTIDKITQYAIYVSEPEFVILFGSMADGRYDVFSDIDLLIVTELNIDKRMLAKQIRSYAAQFSMNADVLIHSMKEMQESDGKPLSFLHLVRKNGKIIFKKNLPGT